MNVLVRLDAFLDEEGELDRKHPDGKWVSVQWFSHSPCEAFEWSEFYDGLVGRFRRPRGVWNRVHKRFFVTRAALAELLLWISECGNHAFWQEYPYATPPRGDSAEDARDEVLLSLADASWARLVASRHAGETA